MFADTMLPTQEAYLGEGGRERRRERGGGSVRKAFQP